MNAGEHGTEIEGREMQEEGGMGTPGHAHEVPSWGWGERVWWKAPDLQRADSGGFGDLSGRFGGELGVSELPMGRWL